MVMLRREGREDRLLWQDGLKISLNVNILRGGHMERAMRENRHMNELGILGYRGQHKWRQTGRNHDRKYDELIKAKRRGFL